MNNKDKISFLPNELIYTIKVVKPPEALSSTETNERVGLNKTDTIGVTAAAESDSGRVPGDPPPLSSSISSRSSSSGKKRNLPSWMKEQSVITTSVKKKGGKSIEKQPTVARGIFNFDRSIAINFFYNNCSIKTRNHFKFSKYISIDIRH